MGVYTDEPARKEILQSFLNSAIKLKVVVSGTDNVTKPARGIPTPAQQTLGGLSNRTGEILKVRNSLRH